MNPLYRFFSHWSGSFFRAAPENSPVPHARLLAVIALIALWTGEKEIALAAIGAILTLWNGPPPPTQPVLQPTSSATASS